MFRYTTYNLEQQMIANLVIWYIIGYLHKHIYVCLRESKLPPQAKLNIHDS